MSIYGCTSYKWDQLWIIRNIFICTSTLRCWAPLLVSGWLHWSGAWHLALLSACGIKISSNHSQDTQRCCRSPQHLCYTARPDYKLGQWWPILLNHFEGLKSEQLAHALLTRLWHKNDKSHHGTRRPGWGFSWGFLVMSQDVTIGDPELPSIVCDGVCRTIE